MKLSFHFLFTIISLSIVLSTCGRKGSSDVAQLGDSAQIEEKGSGRYRCEDIIDALESSNISGLSWKDNEFISSVRHDNDGKEVLFRCLVGELERVCSEDAMASQDLALITQNDFVRIKSSGDILTEAGVSRAVPVLIKCLPRSLGSGRLTRSNTPAVDPILQFDDLATPYLIEAYQTANKTNKCRIVSVLSMMRNYSIESLERKLGTKEVATIRRCINVEKKKH